MRKQTSFVILLSSLFYSVLIKSIVAFDMVALALIEAER